MNFIFLHDRNEIEEFLRKDIYLNIYGIGEDYNHQDMPASSAQC